MSKTNSNVCHAWAHSRSAESGNMSTDGTRLLSYSTLIGYNTGRGLVFITDDGWTPTTKKQLCDAHRATRHMDVVTSPYFEYGRKLYDFDEKQAFKSTCEALNATIEGYNKARLTKYLASNITYAIDKTIELTNIAINYGYDVPLFSTISAERVIAATDYARNFDNTRKQREAQALLNRQSRDAKAFTAWRDGEPVSCPSSYRVDAQGGHYIVVRGDKVVTSGGAECPIEHARLGIRFWRSRDCKEGLSDVQLSMSGADLPMFEPWERNGHKVPLGIFQLDSIDEHGTARAGCHTFYASELIRLADALL
jgi:hypothetical protein